MSEHFEVFAAPLARLPIVISVPHAGRDYPSDLLSRSRIDRSTLRRSEDPDVDALFTGARDLGVAMIVARTARLYVDLNRAPDELDPEMFAGPLDLPVDARSMRAANGLGVFPRFASNGAEIYTAKLDPAEARKRLEEIHSPFHRALEALLEETRRRFGFAILIDGHSMPSVAGPGEVDHGRTRADFVLGDRHGASAVVGLGDRAAAELRQLGYSTTRNDPYAGAYIAAHHGEPAADIHVLQIEINRSLYLDERRLERHAGFGPVADALLRLVARLGDLDLRSSFREAAE